jgi:4-hydroxythreonine-4-phosphate dehydrogenase
VSNFFALTQGDPAGIGLEIALKSWLLRHESNAPPFFVLSDPDYVKARAALLGLNIPVQTISSADQADFKNALPVFPTGFVPTSLTGHPSQQDAASTIGSIEQGVALVKNGQAKALVTNPIAKSVLYQSGFAFPGHTEFLGSLADGAKTVMMLWCKDLAVVPITVHIPLKDVALTLTTQMIVETAQIVAHSLRKSFGLSHPRLAITGLNPHAGEQGSMGKEDEEIITPAIKQLKQLGIDASGPYPADTLFHARARARYDVVLAMYHDQALIPIKTLAFDEAVNVTLGLPFIRTSPDHGTAFDIAGKGIARPDSLIAALKLASQMSAG